MKQVFVEGNVGAGKSTVLSYIKDTLNIPVWPEPCDLWENVGGQNLLQRFFKDQKRWSFTLQNYITTTQIRLLQQAYREHGNALQFFERSVYSGRYCFAENLHDMNCYDAAEWGVYTSTWDLQVEDRIQRPAAFIYLRVPADICFERIQKRGRSAEHPISLEYLKRLEQKHDSWLLHKKDVPSFLTEVPILVIDGAVNFVDDGQVQKEYMSKIERFVKTL